MLHRIAQGSLVISRMIRGRSSIHILEKTISGLRMGIVPAAFR